MGDYNFGSDGQWKFLGFLVVLGFLTLTFGTCWLVLWLIDVFIRGLNA